MSSVHFPGDSLRSAASRVDDYTPERRSGRMSRRDIASALKASAVEPASPPRHAGGFASEADSHIARSAGAGRLTSGTGHASWQGGTASRGALSVAGDGAGTFSPAGASAQRSHVEYYERELTRLQLELDRAMDKLNEERRLRLSQTLRNSEQGDELTAAERRERALRDDVASLRSSSAAATSEADRLRDEVARSAKAHAALHKQLQEVAAEGEVYRQRCAEAEAMVVSLRTQVAEQAARLATQDSDLRSAAQTSAAAAEEAQGQASQLADYKRRLQAEAVQVGQLRGDLDEARETLAKRDSTVASLRRQLEEASLGAQASADDLASRDRQLAALSAKLDTATKSLKSKERRLGEATDALETAKRAAAAATSQVATLTAQLAAARSESQDRDNAVRSAQAATAAHSQASKDLKAENEALQEDVQRLTRQLAHITSQARNTGALAREAATKGVQLEERHAVLKRKYGEMKRRAKDEATARAAAEAAVLTLRTELERLSKLHGQVLDEVRAAGLSAVEAVQESSAATLRAMAAEYTNREGELRTLLSDTQDALLHTRDVLIATGSAVPSHPPPSSAGDKALTRPKHSPVRHGGARPPPSRAPTAGQASVPTGSPGRTVPPLPREVGPPAPQPATPPTSASRRFVSLGDGSTTGGHGLPATARLRQDGSAEVLDLPHTPGRSGGGGGGGGSPGKVPGAAELQAAADSGIADIASAGQGASSEARQLLQRTTEAYLRLLQSPTYKTLTAPTPHA